MWYKCLNPNCGFVFTRATEYDRCPDCGKQYLREATNEEIESVAKNGEECKPSLDDVIKEARKRHNAQDIPLNLSNQDEENQLKKSTPEYIPIPQEPER